ncbi:MAG: threonine synthase [Rhodobacterales bacterium]|nr:threonine synthase [Rhodobacterales bacterium]
MSYVTHLECSATGEALPAGRLTGLSPAGAPMLVRYDLAAVAARVDRDALAARPATPWRFAELLPLADPADLVSLGETITPLIPLPTQGPGTLWVKDEGLLPTGSFKARGLALAVSMARALGARRLAIPTAGNAGAAMAAYAARAGLQADVFVPADAPRAATDEIRLFGAALHVVDGLIDACGRALAERTAAEGWFDLSTLKEPYRIEGKKTMGLELAQQLGWRLPDAIFYPTGGGTGLIGMAKAFAELKALGWVDGPPPRMVAVQTTGCAPVVRAHAAGRRTVEEPWQNVDTRVHGVRVPKPLGDRLILDGLYESDGFGWAVDDDAVDAARLACARAHGLHLSPEGAACLAAHDQARAAGRLAPDARAVVFNSASGLKSPLPAGV